MADKVFYSEKYITEQILLFFANNVSNPFISFPFHMKKFLRDYIKVFIVCLIQKEDLSMNRQQFAVLIQTICQIFFKQNFFIQLCCLKLEKDIKLESFLVHHLKDLINSSIKEVSADNINEVLIQKSKELFIDTLKDLYKKKKLNEAQFDLIFKYLNDEILFFSYKDSRKKNISYLGIKEIITQKKVFEVEFRTIILASFIKSIPEKFKNDIYKNFEGSLINRLEYYKDVKRANLIFNKNRIQTELKELYSLLISEFYSENKRDTEKYIGLIILFIVFGLVNYVFSVNVLLQNFAIVKFLLGSILSFFIINLFFIKYRSYKVRAIIMKYSQNDCGLDSLCKILKEWLMAEKEG